MLPPIDVCRARIAAFKDAYPDSTYDAFWTYKKDLEARGLSILDDRHIGDTSSRLRNMLRSPEWRMARRGVAGVDTISEILLKARSEYEAVRTVTLGSGQIPEARRLLSLLFRGLVGIANTYDRDPNEYGECLLVGKSKILMFMWGQTPAFDSVVRKAFDGDPHGPSPFFLPHSQPLPNRVPPGMFCSILEELDRWVEQWPCSNGCVPFATLDEDLPVGRIIDMIYYMS